VSCLAPASFNTPKSVQATLLGVSSPLAISLLSPFAWIAQGAMLDISLSGLVLANGIPAAGNTVNYQVVKGTGALSAPSAITISTGWPTPSFIWQTSGEMCR
jgi:hypothetical protein